VTWFQCYPITKSRKATRDIKEGMTSVKDEERLWLKEPRRREKTDTEKSIVKGNSGKEAASRVAPQLELAVFRLFFDILV